MARSNRDGKRRFNWLSRQKRRIAKRSVKNLSVESLESRWVLDGTGFPGNECPPDLDLSAVATQQVTVGETLTLDLLAAGATTEDLDEAGDPTGDTLRFLLDPDSPSQTPAGASITSAGVFTWSPTAEQVGTFSIVVILLDEGTPVLGDAEVFTVEVLPGDQAPEVDLNGAATGIDFDATFTEDGGAVAAVDDDELTVTDADSTDLASATVTITNLADGADELLAVDTTGTSITASYDDSAGVLTLTGSDSLANYQQVLRTLTYDNSSQDPTEGDRVIEVVVSDGGETSTVATSTIAVVAGNDAPEVDLNGADADADFETTFAEGEDAVAIVDAEMTITDVDDSEIVSATVTITNLLDGAAELLAVDTAGTSITAAYDDSTGVLSLTGADTVAAYQQVLRTLTYDNSSADPTSTARTVEVVVSDGDDSSVVRTATVNITTANDAPNLASIDDQDAFVGEELVVQVTATDPDGGDTLTFDLDEDNSPEGATLVQTSGTTAEIRWTPSAGDLDTTVDFVVLVFDDGDPVQADSEAFSVTVSPARPAVDLNGDDPGTGLAVSFTEGDDPISLAESDITITSEASSTIASATITLTNPEELASETLEVNESLVAGITVDYAGGVLTLSGEESIANYQAVLETLTYQNTSEDPTEGDRIIEIVVNDGTTDSGAAMATVSVTAVNDLPELTVPQPYDNPSSPVEIMEGHLVEFTVTASDVDHDVSELTYSIDLDGSGLSVDAAEPSITNPGGVFSWTPDATGSFTFLIEVTDADGGATQEQVAFTVVADTTAPTVTEGPTGTFAAPINSLTINFSEAMGPAAFEVANYTLTIVGGANDGQVITISDVSTTDDVTATLTLATDLALESYSLALDDTDIADSAGNLLDGDIEFDFDIIASEV